MSEAGAHRLPKPQLRGLLATHFRKHAVIAAVFGVVNMCLFKVFVADARKKRYADFYKDYDPEKEFEAMRKTGVFQNV